MMNALPRPLPPGSRWIPLALTVAVVSGCGLTGSPADFPTPSPPPSTTPPPLPPPVESVPELHCPARTRLPDTVEVNWSGAAPVHRAAGPDGTSLLAAGCRPLPLRA
ncbi:hypothetical protein [Streptomyces sp. NRRL S-1448]|uniref:hypothetical protein n=1 Tax=Streptomyces sp. NRRL S-1448 TaxID=1463883 RepID=UPI000A6648F2|nr:hypothetical protein [Streptomyces sp. NRRL S-1448]